MTEIGCHVRTYNFTDSCLEFVKNLYIYDRSTWQDAAVILYIWAKCRLIILHDQFLWENCFARYSELDLYQKIRSMIHYSRPTLCRLKSLSREDSKNQSPGYPTASNSPLFRRFITEMLTSIQQWLFRCFWRFFLVMLVDILPSLFHKTVSMIFPDGLLFT